MSTKALLPGWISRLRKIPMEAVIWTVALLGLALMPSGAGFSLCPLSALGLDFCPGCGLGHSIHHALNGRILSSWAFHPLGIPVITVLCYRIVSLIRNQPSPVPATT